MGRPEFYTIKGTDGVLLLSSDPDCMPEVDGIPTVQCPDQEQRRMIELFEDHACQATEAGTTCYWVPACSCSVCVEAANGLPRGLMRKDWRAWKRNNREPGARPVW